MKAVGLIISFVLFLSVLSFSQAIDEQGIKPYGSYHGGDIDIINLNNSKLELHIPLLSYPQRGRLQLGFELRYQSEMWDETKSCVPNQPCFYVWNEIGSTGQVNVFREPGVPTVNSQIIAPNGQCPDQCAYTVKFWDGSQHPLGRLGGSIYRSLDATGVLWDSSTGNVIMPDGTRLNVMEDANGNKITTDPNTAAITDSLGRVVPFGTGAATTDYTGCTGPLPVVAATTWTVPGSNGSSNTFKFCNVNVLVFTHHFATDDSHHIEPNGNQSMLQSLVLPDGTAWTFEYTQPDANGVNYGDLVKVTYPTGASVSFTWTHGTGCHAQYGYLGSTASFVTSRTVDANDGTGPHTWHYSGGGLLNTVTDPLGNDVVHTFTDLSGCSLFETQTQYYAGSSSSGALLKTVNTDYSWSPNPNFGGPNPPPAMNVVPIRVTTVWPDGQTTKTEYSYDSGFIFTGVADGIQHTGIYGKQTALNEFDYASGAPGPLLRSTQTGYLWQSPAWAQYLTYNVLDVPNSVTVYDGANHQIASTTSGYDNGAPGPSGISTMHDAAPPNGNTRGNLTSVSHWLNGSTVSTTNCPVSVTNGYLTETKTYFDTGLVSQSEDPCGHTTTFQYSSLYAGAYLTSSCDALNHCTTMEYNLNPGLVASITDPNGQVSGKKTSYTYDDIGRLTVATYPDGGETNFYYPDAVTLEMKKLEDAVAGTWIDHYTYFDGLLRPKQTRLVDPEGDDFVDTTYDPVGRVSTVSNPHRATTSATDGITSTYYDALGRVVQVAPPDGTVLSSSTAPTVCQPGNRCTDLSNFPSVTSTDEAGKQRRSRSDALERLVEVDEPGDASAGAQAQGNITINDPLNSKPTIPGASGSGSITISGAELQTVTCTTTCTSRWDTGTIQISVVLPTGTITKQKPYGQGSSAQLIATDLANQFSGDSNFTNVNVVENSTTSYTINLTANAVGSATNYPYSTFVTSTKDFSAATAASTFTNGSDGQTGATDSGTITVKIGSFTTAPVCYGTSCNGTAALVASALAVALNVSGSPVQNNVHASGNTISMTANAFSASWNVAVTATPTSSDPADFPNGSFASQGALGGGADPYPSGLAHPFVTLYSYDALGNLSRVDQKGSAPADSTQWRTRTFSYDSLSHLTQSNNPESGQINYSYDADGNVITKTAPAPSQPAGSTATVTTNFTYDPLNRVTAKSYTGNGYTETTPAMTYGYDQGCCGVNPQNGIGRMTYASGGNTELVYVYDPMGRITSQADCPPSGIARGFCYNISAAYNQLGALTSLTYPSGRQVNTAYSTAGRLLNVQLAVPGGGLYSYYAAAQGAPTPASSWGYWPSGEMRLGNYGNGVQELTNYNSRLQMSTISDTQGATTLFSKSYNLYDSAGHNNGNVMGITDLLNSAKNQTYTYDALNRIATASETDSAFSISYNIDPWGNMKESGTSNFAPVFTTANQMQGWSYSPAGNLLADTLHSYAYDGENRISKVDNGSTATYTYNPLGNRVRKDAGASSTEYFFFGGNIISELNPASGAFTDYIFGGGKRYAKDTSTNGTGAQFYHSDHLGSTRIMTDASGTKISDCTYGPYGEEVSCSPNNSSNHYKFTGKERDSESGLDNFGARYDSSNMGRFMTPDPLPWIHWQHSNKDEQRNFTSYIANPQHFNMYAYVLNNPLRYTDPTGMNACGGKDDSTCKVTVTLTDRSKDKNGQYNDQFAKLKGNGSYNAVATVSVNGKVVGTYLADTVSSGNGKFATIQNGTYEGVLHFHHGDPNKPSIELLSGGQNHIPTTGPNPAQGGASFATDVLIHSAGGTRSNPLGYTGLLPNGHGVSEACQLVCTVQYQQFLGATGIQNADGSPPQQHFSVVVDTSENQ